MPPIVPPEDVDEVEDELDTDPAPISDELKSLLDERLAEADRDPDAGIPAFEALQRLIDRARR